MTKDGLLLLGFDPGTSNFAFALAESEPVALTIKQSGVLATVAKADTLYGFYLGALKLLRALAPDYVIIEQYQYRGVQSIHAEKVNLMVGCLYAAWCFAAEMTDDFPDETPEERARRFIFVLPTAWKTPMKRLFGRPPIKRGKVQVVTRRAELDYSYLFNLPTPHEVDAACMTLWYHCQRLQRQFTP